MTATVAPRLQADTVRDELVHAFADADLHGHGCRCCEDSEGIQTHLVREALYALDRFRPGEGLTDATTNAEIDALVELAAGDALRAARDAIIRRAVEGLAS